MANDSTPYRAWKIPGGYVQIGAGYALIELGSRFLAGWRRGAQVTPWRVFRNVDTLHVRACAFWLVLPWWPVARAATGSYPPLTAPLPLPPPVPPAPISGDLVVRDSASASLRDFNRGIRRPTSAHLEPMTCACCGEDLALHAIAPLDHNFVWDRRMS